MTQAYDAISVHINKKTQELKEDFKQINFNIYSMKNEV